MKKALAVFLSAALILPTAIISVSAEEIDKGAPTAFNNGNALYAHAVLNSADADAWQAWQSVHDESFYERDTSTKYFFLPTSASETRVDIYNGYTSSVTVNGTVIPSHETKTVTYTVNSSTSVSAGGRTYTLKFMKSHAEAAIYINNSDADGNGTDLMSYLNADKSRSAAATGAIVDPDGKIDNTPVKKIKGRGNTTWGKPKKAYNITYNKKVSIGGMEKNKKFSILANYQDDTMARNRVLYDLSDAVGLPYASDSRFVDFYVNGHYRGSYQMCEKVGADSLAPDIDTESYLNEDGTVKENFPFICEVDASANSDDYHTTLSNGVNITLKDPEIDPGQPGYYEVLANVKQKFEQFTNVAVNKNGKISDVADLDSVTKLYLINELGKNWDSGVSSTFFTYKADNNGNFKFYGSPVWDYDNSLGNAVGVGSDLNQMGVSDYTKFSGWWCRYKSKSANESYARANIINNLSVNNEVQQAAARIWFENFMPAIRQFAGTVDNPLVSDEIYSSKKYYALLSDSADMNYTSGWLLNPVPGWLASHNSVQQATYDLNTNTYTVKSRTLSFGNNFKGMYDYMTEWTLSRAAWLSSQMAQTYGKKQYKGDANFDGITNINDVTEIQKYIASMTEFTPLQYELSNVRSSDALNISDATAVQRALARIEPLPGNDDDEPDPESYTVTFTNTLDWSGDIYCYSWYYDGSDGNAVWNSTWPGTKMTLLGKDAGGHDVYSLTIPSDMTYVIFNNGSNNTDNQTDDIPFNPSTPNYRALSGTTTRGCHYCEESATAPVIVTDPETNPQGGGDEEPDSDTYTITYTNTLNWEGTINCYSYHIDGSQVVYPAAWPGAAMTYTGTNAQGQDVYRIDIPKNTDYVIFNNNNLQTDKYLFDSSARNFYALDQTNPINGRYYCAAY